MEGLYLGVGRIKITMIHETEHNPLIISNTLQRYRDIHLVDFEECHGQSAKSSNNLGINELIAFNIVVNTVDTQTFFGNPNLPQLKVSPQ